MQSIELILPYFFAIIILFGFLWMVIQKISLHLSTRSFKFKFLEEDEKRSEVSSNNDTSRPFCTDTQPGIKSTCNSKISGDDISLQVRDGSIKPCQNNLCSISSQFLTSEAFKFHHAVFCKTKLDGTMTSDTDTTMAEPQSTNYNSGDSKSFREIKYIRNMIIPYINVDLL